MMPFRSRLRSRFWPQWRLRIDGLENALTIRVVVADPRRAAAARKLVCSDDRVCICAMTSAAVVVAAAALTHNMRVLVGVVEC